MKKKYLMQAALSLMSGSLFGQDLPFLKFDYSGSLDLGYQTIQEEHYSNTFSPSLIDEEYLEAGLSLSSKGFFYHPNLLKFHISATWVKNRAELADLETVSAHKAANDSHHIILTVFQKKKLNFEIYSHRFEGNTNRAYLGRVFSDAESLGVRIFNKTRFFPFSLDIYDRDQKTETLVGLRRDEKTRGVSLRSKILEGSTARWDLDVDFKNDQARNFQTETDWLQVRSSLKLNYGTENRNQLVTHASYDKFAGSINSERPSVMLTNRHVLRKNLFLLSRYTFRITNIRELSLSRHEAGATLTHELYQSLVSTFNLRGWREGSANQDIEHFEWLAAMNYRKRFPTGMVTARLSRGNEKGDFSSGHEPLFRSEEITFSTVGVVTLPFVGIDVASILLTGVGTSQVFFEGLDYSLNHAGDSVTLIRLPGGNIGPEATVLVQFEALAFPDYTIDSQLMDSFFGLRFLRYFYVYYSARNRKPELNSRFLVSPFESLEKRTLGGKIELRWASAEYSKERYRSNFADYTATRWRMGLHHTFFNRLKTAAYANSDETTYTDGRLFFKLEGISANLSWRYGRHLTAELGYRLLDYLSIDVSRLRESLVGRIRWRFRQMEFDLQLEQLFDDVDQSIREREMISVKLRRRF